MLELKNIIKIYDDNETKVDALKGVSFKFRKSEFVSVLGPSGCGKTTLLNVIGGLDKYTDGDLIINGKTTKEFNDKDWDTYRNHSVGFVFQSYNLIHHQSVLMNVELALTLSGVDSKTRRKKAKEALKAVGLEDQIKKSPNQLSGGQMQRVAIARALVNDPDILLADEPTGALDSETSIQIMELLKEIAKNKLVIMVTHNEKIADAYSTRIIKLLDGDAISDSNPYDGKEEIEKKDSVKKVSMSFWTAFRLSLANLFTKKARTFLTVFAGSIGIIGIALVMSVSNGFQNYISRVQEDTLSSYPITLSSSSTNMFNVFFDVLKENEKEITHGNDKVYSKDMVQAMFKSISAQMHDNDLEKFKKVLDKRYQEDKKFKANINDIRYTYNISMNIFRNEGNKVVQVNPERAVTKVIGGSGIDMPPMMEMNIWQEMLDNSELLNQQYDVVYGKWPSSFDEVVVVLDKNNEITDYTLYSLGLKTLEELQEVIDKAKKGEVIDFKTDEYSYEDIANLKFKLIQPTDVFKKTSDGKWHDLSKGAANEAELKNIVEKGMDIKVSGIIRAKPGSVAQTITGNIGYTKGLTKYVIEKNNKAQIIKDQLSNKEIDVFSNSKFVKNEMTMDKLFDMFGIDEATKGSILNMLHSIGVSDDTILNAMNNVTYEKNLRRMGYVNINDPSSISIYPKDFKSKQNIEKFLKEYNEDVTNRGHEENVISYTDYLGIFLSSVTTILDAVTYVLIGFISISLIVSSIMIGIITYISVLERTKEIGVLRSIGASKKDVSWVFNAETILVGFASGIFGILITLLLTIPLNLILAPLTHIESIASLPIIGAIVLITISVVLTFIAGIIPARIASSKDPVKALRSE